jgi:hypothetical protein
MRPVETVAGATSTNGATEVERRQSSPSTGKLSARPAGKPGILSSLWRICDDAFSATVPPWLQRTILGAQYAFSEAWRNLSGPMWFPKQNQTLGRDRVASRRSAPGPGKRTRREDHVPSHRPQMSSGRLFLDRVARQHCPSPLYRRPQHNMHFSHGPGKGDISTLHKRVTFLLCVDNRQIPTCIRHKQHIYSFPSIFALMGRIQFPRRGPQCKRSPFVF